MDNNYTSSHSDRTTNGQRHESELCDHGVYPCGVTQPRSAVRYGSGVRYADSSQCSGAHGSASLLLSVIAFLLMVMTPLVSWLIVPCLCAIATSLYFCYKALRGTRGRSVRSPRMMAYSGMALSLMQLSVMALLSLGVAWLDYKLPY